MYSTVTQLCIFFRFVSLIAYYKILSIVPVYIKTKQNKQPNQKLGRRYKQTFLQRRHKDGQ